MLSKLIGSQLVSINDYNMVVNLNDKYYTLYFKEDNGDCCGYAFITTELMYKDGDVNNPVITNIEYNDEEGHDGDSLIITFYGQSKQIAKIESECGSGSGWSYGATASVVCKELDIYEILTSW